MVSYFIPLVLFSFPALCLKSQQKQIRNFNISLSGIQGIKYVNSTHFALSEATTKDCSMFVHLLNICLFVDTIVIVFVIQNKQRLDCGELKKQKPKHISKKRLEGVCVRERNRVSGREVKVTESVEEKTRCCKERWIDEERK